MSLVKPEASSGRLVAARPLTAVMPLMGSAALTAYHSRVCLGLDLAEIRRSRPALAGVTGAAAC